MKQSTMLELGTPAPPFSLPDGTGRLHKLEEFAAAPALLVAFICNHCPYVKHILDGFVSFAAEYQRKGIATVAISSNDVATYPADGPAEMARLAAARGRTGRTSMASHSAMLARTQRGHGIAPEGAAGLIPPVTLTAALPSGRSRW